MALRRFRVPVPARVAVHEGRPVRVATGRRGLDGGAVTSATGPWRTSGEWWKTTNSWSRDEWDVALEDGSLCRIYLDRLNGGWFVEGRYD